MQITWVKKRVSNADWRSWFSHDSTYCFLGKDDSGVWVGFLIPGESIPMTCETVSDNELRLIDDYRISHNIYPRPLSDVKPILQEASQKSENTIF